jgi:hypothetical protein
MSPGGQLWQEGTTKGLEESTQFVMLSLGVYGEPGKRLPLVSAERGRDAPHAAAAIRHLLQLRFVVLDDGERRIRDDSVYTRIRLGSQPLKAVLTIKLVPLHYWFLMRATQKVLVDPAGFNKGLALPYQMTWEEVARAVQQVYDILHSIDAALKAGDADRLEEFMHPANFSFLLSELMVGGLSRFCQGLVKNNYHNGHPDLLPVGVYAGDSVLRAEEGIEVKCSRNPSGWQGHNAEDSWVLVAVYKLDCATEPPEQRTPTYFSRVMIANLLRSDWSFAGRGEGSRRTPTASILRSGTAKLIEGTIYEQPEPVLLAE